MSDFPWVAVGLGALAFILFGWGLLATLQENSQDSYVPKTVSFPVKQVDNQFEQDSYKDIFNADYLVAVTDKNTSLCIPWNFSFQRDHIEDWVFLGYCPKLETHNPHSTLKDSNILVGVSIGLHINMPEYNLVSKVSDYAIHVRNLSEPQ